MIAYDILKFLDKKNVAIENIDLFVGFEPENPANCITLYDESAPSLDESSCLAVDMFGLHVLVRNENYQNALKKIEEIHSLIAGYGGNKFIQDGKFISYITVSTSPYFLGKDEKGRNQFTAHYYGRVEMEDNNNRL